MKIIITVASYYPDKNGVQAVTQYQAEGLVKKGHEVIVITKLIEGRENIEFHNGVKIIRTNIYNKYTLHFGNKNEYRNLILKESNDADVIIAICLQSVSADWLLGILDQIKCKKILYMHGMHDFKWYKHDFKTLIDFLKKLIRDIRWKTFYSFYLNKISKFDLVMHLHKQDDSYKYFEKHNLSKNIIIENCANDEFFYKTTYTRKINENYILCVANYNSRKNQEMIIESFFKANTKDYSLVLIGSKKNKYYYNLVNKIKRLSAIYGEKKVQLLTDIKRDEIPNYVSNASCYVMASTWEAFPISITEAMASGVPFISTNVGIIKFLPGGVIVDNIDEMSAWIETFIENQEISKQLGEIGKKYAVKNFRKDAKIDKIEENILAIM